MHSRDQERRAPLEELLHSKLDFLHVDRQRQALPTSSRACTMRAFFSLSNDLRLTAARVFVYR